MIDKTVLWDYDVLDMLCGATGYKQNVLKDHIVKLAKEMGTKLPHEKEGKVVFY